MTPKRIPLLAPVAVGALSFAGLVWLDGAELDPAQRRLDAVVIQEEPTTYIVDDLVDAAQLLGCFIPVTNIEARVDRIAERASLRLDGSTFDQIILTSGRSYVHRDLLDGWALATQWLVLDSTTPPATIAVLEAAIGPAASRYVLRFGLPDGPIATARALAAATDDLTLEATPQGSARILGVVDPEDLPEDSSRNGADPTADDPFEVTIVISADDTVEAITARRFVVSDTDLFGIALEYHDQGAPLSIEVPAAGEVTSADRIDPTAVPAPPLLDECVIG